MYRPTIRRSCTSTPPPPAPVVGPTSGDVIAAGLIGFTAGVIVGSMFNNNRYYPYPNWGYGGVWYGGNPYSRNVYVYAPNYNRGYPPGYRPGYGYRPPANYPNGWNRASTLPAYNSSNYYNRFNGNQNLRPGNSPPPLVGNNVSNRPGAYRPTNSGNNTTVSRGNNTNNGNVTINNNFNNGNQPGSATGRSRVPHWCRPRAARMERPAAISRRASRHEHCGATAARIREAAQPARTTGSPLGAATPAAGPASPRHVPAPAARPGADRGFGGATTGAQPIAAAPLAARPSTPAASPDKWRGSSGEARRAGPVERPHLPAHLQAAAPPELSRIGRR